MTLPRRGPRFRARFFSSDFSDRNVSPVPNVVPSCPNHVSKVHKKLFSYLSKLHVFNTLSWEQQVLLIERSIVMRTCHSALLAVGILLPASGTMLQKLSMDEMIQKSTLIVRAKVTGSHAAFLGRDIYTYYQLQVLEGWKLAGQQIEVAVPGGAARGLRQLAPGSPSLNPGDEYVMFLWTSRSGLTQIIGLSQGLFSVKLNSAGDAVLIRPAGADMMLDKSGKVVSDEAVTIRLSDLRIQIQNALGGK